VAVPEVQQADHLSRLFSRALRRLLATGLDERCGLTDSQYQALAFIGSHPGCTVGELATGLAVTCPAATKLVDRLEAKGLALRQTWDLDRRRVKLELREPGSRRLALVEQARLQALDQVLSQLNRPERVGLLRGLEVLLSAVVTDAGLAASLCLHCGTGHDQACPLNRLHRALAGTDLPATLA